MIQQVTEASVAVMKLGKAVVFCGANIFTGMSVIYQIPSDLQSWP